MKGDPGDIHPALKKSVHRASSATWVRTKVAQVVLRLRSGADGGPWRRKPTAPDGLRYKTMGNSMAVPVMRRIGERIATVSALAVNADEQ